MLAQDPEQERRATMALQLRQAIQGLEPQIMAMTVQRALEVLREGERMHKHKTVNSGR